MHALAHAAARRLARAGNFDYIMIEGSGIAEPLPIAEAFTFDEPVRFAPSLMVSTRRRAPAAYVAVLPCVSAPCFQVDGVPVKEFAMVDTMVTVVDAFNFLRDYKGADTLEKRKMAGT